MELDTECNRTGKIHQVLNTSIHLCLHFYFIESLVSILENFYYIKPPTLMTLIFS